MSILAAFMVPHPPMIVPEIGKGSEERVRATIRSYETVASEIAELRPDTVIITSPHATMYADYFHISPGYHAKGSFANFGVPNVTFEESYDVALRERIELLCQEEGFPAGTQGERDPRLDHGTMVPLWYLHRKCDGFQILRIGLSGLSLPDHYHLGELIRQAVDESGRRVVFVASGDLSHKLQEYGPYGFAPEGPEYDRRIMDTCGRAAFDELLDYEESFCDKASECGHRSFVIMAGALDGIAVTPRTYSHEDVTGVGYGICSFYPQGPDETRHFRDTWIRKKKEELEQRAAGADAYVRLARQSLEGYILSGKSITLPEDLPAELLTRQAGAFVSIHKEGRLRGCIGTILPTEDCLANEIIQNAISASTRDPRFDPIRPEELPLLEINVDVLSAPEDIDSPEELDVKRYGVIVSCGSRRGLLLPDLEGVDTVEQQISIARRKGGISEKEKVRLQRFEVIRHK